MLIAKLAACYGQFALLLPGEWFAWCGIACLKVLQPAPYTVVKVPDLICRRTLCSCLQITELLQEVRKTKLNMQMWDLHIK